MASVLPMESEVPCASRCYPAERWMTGEEHGGTSMLDVHRVQLPLGCFYIFWKVSIHLNVRVWPDRYYR